MRPRTQKLALHSLETERWVLSEAFTPDSCLERTVREQIENVPGGW